MYLSGHLHRDPSLGIFLMVPQEIDPKGKKFEIEKEFYDSPQDVKTKEEIKNLCDKIQDLAIKLRIPNEHSAVITDGDLAIKLSTYWEMDRREARSVSEFLITWGTGLDKVYRVHLSSCPGVF